MRFRLRGVTRAEDEYGVVIFCDALASSFHVQVCAPSAYGMLVPQHEIAFSIAPAYGDKIDLVLKEFSMEMQLRPSKFLLIFEPGAVVGSAIATAPASEAQAAMAAASEQLLAPQPHEIAVAAMAADADVKAEAREW